MMTERQTRISQLARSNKARLSCDEFLRGLSQALGRPIDSESLLSISDSDSLRAGYQSGYQRAANGVSDTYRDIQPTVGLASISAKIEKLQGILLSEGAVLLPSHFEQCVRGEIGEVLKQRAQILKFDGDTLMLASPNGVSGLMLDWNPDDSEETYEFAVWGADWTGALL